MWQAWQYLKITHWIKPGHQILPMCIKSVFESIERWGNHDTIWEAVPQRYYTLAKVASPKVQSTMFSSQLKTIAPCGFSLVTQENRSICVIYPVDIFL